MAREAAELVAFDRDLGVIRRGVEEGRRTVANTLAGQILLNNLLSDVPAVGIADDKVDPEDVARPRR